MNFIKYFKRGDNLNFFFNLIFSLILFPRNLKPLIILVFSIAIIIVAITKKNKPNWKFFLINSSVYFLVLLTMFYTEDLKAGSLKLQTMLSMLLFPLLFSLISKEKYLFLYKNRYSYFHFYIGSVILFNLIVFIWMFINNPMFYDITKHFSFIVNSNLGKYNIHPIYLSIHIGLGIIFSFFSWKNKKSLYKILLTILLFFFLIILSKKGPVISLIIVFLYIFLFSLVKKHKKKALISLLLFIILMSTLSRVRDSFSELFKVEELTEDNISSTNIRLAIYKTSLKPINNSFFFGYGIGDYNKILSDSYNKEVLVKGNYNSHNQYISFVLLGGVLILIVFISIQIYNIKLAVRKSDYLFIAVSLFYLLNMLTENILERENGVIFFSFFISFLAYKNYIINEE